MDQISLQTRSRFRYLDLGFVRRRFVVLSVVTAIAFIAGAIIISRLPVHYEATSRIRLDISRSPILAAQDRALARLNDELIDTEVTVISSSMVAEEVVRRLNLVSDAEFKPRSSDRPLSAPEAVEQSAQSLMRSLDVARERLTYIIAIRFRSREPDKAARIANEFAEAYINTKSGARVDAARQQVQWLEQRLEELAADVRSADAQVAQYRASAGIVQGQSVGTITDQQVAPLSSEIASAEAEAAGARGRLTAAQQQVERGDVYAVSGVLNSPVITSLREQRAAALQALKGVEARYGGQHPETIRARSQLASVDSEIRSEASRIVGSLRVEAEAAASRLQSLRQALANLSQRQGRNTRAAVLAEALERDATSKRAAYDKVAEALLDANQTARDRAAQAEIIDRAQPLAAAASPNRKLLLVLAFVAALAVGIAAALMREFASRPRRAASPAAT